jgi:phage gpG-like protein
VNIKLTGQWKEAVRDTMELARIYESAAQKAINKEALLWAKEVRDGIRTQRSAAEANWPPLADSTLAAKAPKSKMLIDTGSLVRSIRSEKVAKWKWLVGVKRGSVGRTEAGAVNLVNIAAVHEFGTTTAGRGRATVIPARPFIKPVRERMSKGIEKRVWDNIKVELRKRVPRRSRL